MTPDRSRPHAIVVGAGIAGVATAAGLHRIGWSVEVHERSARHREAGTGLGLTPNGLRALAALGLDRAVRARSVTQRSGGVRRPDGRWLSRTGLDFIEQRQGHPTVALLRADLMAALGEVLPDRVWRFGEPVSQVYAGGAVSGPARVHSAVASRPADLVVGADGIRSVCRAALFPAHAETRPTGSTSWRFVVEGVEGADDLDAGETWGPGVRVSVLPLGRGRVQCSVLLDTPHHLADGDDHGWLVQRLATWHAPLPRLVAAAAPDAVLRHPIEELHPLPPRFHEGRAVLVGDAAHPMTPNLGAANLALEDAATLVRLLDRYGGGPGAVPGAVAEYSRQRRPRAVLLARRARRIGAVAQWSSPAATSLRAAAVRVGGRIPQRLTARSLDFFMAWEPPATSPYRTAPGTTA